MSTNHDLDALLDEIDAAGDTVTLFGQEWTLPTDVDAETMLRVQRLQMRVAMAKRAGREPSEDDIIDQGVDLDVLVEAMAGTENFAAWREKGLGYRAMRVVAGRLYSIHAGEGATSGKGPKRGPVKRTQTSTGSAQRGKRTSA